MNGFRSVFVAAAILAATLVPQAPAIGQTDADRAGIEAAIAGQLDAFLADDGARAFGFAAPGIRRMFPDEARFMSMVRQGYPPVYRSRSRDFGSLEPQGSGFVQEVFIRDATGEEWIAVYTMERQADGSWLIAGCRLVRRPGFSA